MLPSNGILFNGVLIPKLLNNSFASCFFVNLDFLLPHTTHLDNNIGLPFYVFKTFESTLSVSFSHLNNMSAGFIRFSLLKIQKQ